MKGADEVGAEQLSQAGTQLRRLVSSLDNLCGILNERELASQTNLIKMAFCLGGEHSVCYIKDIFTE